MTDFAPFGFRTKAQNLLQLEHRLSHSTICEIELVTVGAWQSDRTAAIDQVQNRFGSAKLIVRSSATDEDSAEASMAGAFDSVANVDGADPAALARAIEAVANSYQAKHVEGFEQQEILIQPMVPDVVLSGVLFTRDLERNLPYFVINYEESDRTDSITAGTTSAPQRTYRVFRGVRDEVLTEPLNTIIAAAREVELVTGSSALDIEFAMNSTGQFYLLQVRPLVRTQVLSHALMDRRVSDQIAAMTELVSERFQPRPGLAGPTTALGEMPDWNPAEIIGTHPTPLASSLYRHVIMNSTWRNARAELGYRNPAPYQLLVMLAGRPYVDVRCSVNSFLPAGLSSDLSERLVTHYIDRLRANPEFHDKIEFEIVFSSHTFDTDHEQQRLRDDGFDDDDIAAVWSQLFDLTNAAVLATGERTERFEADVASLTERRIALTSKARRIEAIPFIVEQLLEDCRNLGTLPFSIAARCAFVASSFLRSMTSRGVWSEADYHRYTNSIDTVASELVRDLDRLRAGDVSLEAFLVDYGHLRPGTYDVRAASYGDRPDAYLTLSPDTSAPAAAEQHDVDLRLDEVVDAALVQELIDQFGFSFDVDEFDHFVKASIRQREWLKFEFSKNLSQAIDLIAEYGRHHGMNREDVAFIDIDEFLRFANESASTEDISVLKQHLDSRRKLYELTSMIPLPDLVFSTSDIEVVFDQRRKPNFVTQRTVTAEMIQLKDASEIPDDAALAGKIVLIENADPGYDWLFSKDIAGLCTKYGGAASHMTIRCAEFGTPAAIGCGEQIFSELRGATMVRLNCLQQSVEPYGA